MSISLNTFALFESFEHKSTRGNNVNRKIFCFHPGVSIVCSKPAFLNLGVAKVFTEGLKRYQ